MRVWRYRMGRPEVVAIASAIPTSAGDSSTRAAADTPKSNARFATAGQPTSASPGAPITGMPSRLSTVLRSPYPVQEIGHDLDVHDLVREGRHDLLERSASWRESAMISWSTRWACRMDLRSP